MEENLENQQEDITNIENNEDIQLDDINLDEDYVIDWNQNTEEDAIQERETEEVSLGERTEDSEEVDGSIRLESDQGEDADEGEGEEEGGVELGEVYEDEEERPEYEDEAEYEEDHEDGDDKSYGEEWDPLFQFLEDNPGASIEDYLQVTNGYDDLSDEDVLKIHLASENGLDVEDDADEIDFLYQDKFGYDEELDSERDIKLRQIEAKKTLRSTREELSELSEKYKADLKFESAASPEAKEALEFQQQQEAFQETNNQLAQDFQDRTNDYFTNEFKGFEFNYGDGKSQRIKANSSQLAESQADISNFIEKYVGDDGSIEDLGGYHKALWAAQNADALFSHAYEQGKADAVRHAAKTAKNIDMDPRSDRSAESGDKQSRFKLLDDGDHTEDFKFNI